MPPSQKGNNMLLRSMKVHNTWKCKPCDLEFNTRLQFRLHQQKHSKRTWEFKPCDLEFNTRVQLRLHIEKHSKATLKSATERQQERRSKKTTTLNPKRTNSINSP